MDVELAERVTEARESGYSDDQIVQYLGKKNPRVAEALKEGYGSKDILGYITSGPSEIEAGGKKFKFDTPLKAAQFQRSMTGSAVPPEQLANDYGGKPVVAEIPAARQAAPKGLFKTAAQVETQGLPPAFGRAATSVLAPIASFADTTVGSVIPGVIQQFGYPFARVGRTAEEAKALVDQSSSRFEKPFGRVLGVTEDPRYTSEASQRLVKFIGENLDKPVQWLAEKTGLPASDVANMAGTIATPVAARVAPVVTKAVSKGVTNTATALGERQADKVIAASRKSTDEIARIQASRAANKHGILLSASESNPTLRNRARTVAAGGRIVESDFLSAQNAPVWTTRAKEDMGMPRNTILDESAFDKARENLAGPYNRIQEIGRIDADQQFFADLDSIGGAEILGRLPSDPVARLVGQLSERALSPLDGSTILRSIQEYRKTAQDIYKRENGPQPPSAAERAEADASMRIANSLEDLAVRNVSDKNFKQELQAARAEMAKTYAYERATNYATHKVDPNILAKMVSESPSRYTGTLKDLGVIAANFPEVANIGKAKANVAPRLIRSTPSALAGLALGSLAGFPTTGAATGAVLGAVGSQRLRQGMASPKFQERRAMTPDNRLRVPEPEEALPPITNNLPVVFDPRNAVLDERMMMPDMAGPPSPQPSFTVGTGDLQQRTRFNPETGESVYYGPRNPVVVEDVPPSGYFRQPPQPGPVNPTFPQPPVSGGYARGTAEFSPPPPAGPQLAYDLSNLSTEQRRAYEMARGANAEQVNALNPTWNAPPQVTKGGISIEPEAPYWFSDPAMGRSVAPSPLGDPAMVRALLISDPAYRSLTPQQITDRMLDRKWVESTVDKARQKATAFDEIARRAKDQQAVNLARRNREEMLDFAEQLEDRLNAMPTVKYGQGPKTRAAKTLPPVVITAKRLPPEE
jgi:hypothetical protein